MNAPEHRLEIEPTVARDHDLAVEDAALGQVRAQRDLELRKIPPERLQVATLDQHVVAALPHERAEAVPFWLVEPTVTCGEAIGELREHRRDRRLERQLQLHRARYTALS